MSENVTILVLDYQKPEETKLCLESIKKHCKFNHFVTLLCNGGENQQYIIDYYNLGLIDKLILRKTNSGCGNATVELFNSCETNYAIYFQNDQQFINDLTDKSIDFFINLIIERGYGYVDLAGAQAGQDNYSERAGFINVNFYKSIYKGIKNEYGGPGPFNNNTYTENFIQKYFKEKSLKVAHLTSIVQDNGKTSIREIGDGIYSHRCDNKNLKILKIPTYKTQTYPPFDEADWELALSGKWPKEGRVPNQWKDLVFRVWND